MTTQTTVTAAPTAQPTQAWLSRAADSLRGSVDPGLLRDVMLPLLALKSLSDTWHEEQRSNAEHRFRMPDGCRWEDLADAATGSHGRRFAEIAAAVEAANPSELGGLFGHSADWPALDQQIPERLSALVGRLGERSLAVQHTPGDVLGECIEHLLGKFAGWHKGSGQFFTPRSVARLLAELLDPLPGETIYDPACGSAGLLVAAARRAGTVTAYGQESNPGTAAVARMNLLMHGIENKIAGGDTLRSPAFTDGSDGLRTFDVVIANPPFSLKDWGQEAWADDPYRRFEHGSVIPPKNSADIAWMQHMIASADPARGRVGTVLPTGLLTQGSKPVTAFRRFLVESGWLEAVVSLPGSLFANTPIPVSLVVLRPHHRQTVRMADGTGLGTKADKGIRLTDSDIDTLVEASAP